uniref:dymeclin-like isoform X1 n=1 Tax=Oncorhynchus gorbuscha TaxID=8017 RepID=UPI001EAF0BC9|nr:dymeclin-like isoform X1 [Oncorhynchus gorbuscha]XP_046225407.1 dymeclin-like isoform X1 [Oncorhynchus gorbuscha]
MGANTSQVSDLSENQSLRTLIGTESISDNDPFWNQLISFTFISPTSSCNSKLLEEAVIPLAKILIENNPRTGNFGALVRIFLGRTKELKISTECQDQLFIWQAHNTLFMIRCLLKVFIREMTEEELHLQFSYQERVPGSCDTGSEVLLEELMCNLVYLVVEVPLLSFVGFCGAGLVVVSRPRSGPALLVALVYISKAFLRYSSVFAFVPFQHAAVCVRAHMLMPAPGCVFVCKFIKQSAVHSFLCLFLLPLVFMVDISMSFYLGLATPII